MCLEKVTKEELIGGGSLISERDLLDAHGRPVLMALGVTHALPTKTTSQ